MAAACGVAMYFVWPLAFAGLFVGPFIGWHRHDFACGVGAAVFAVVLLAVMLNCSSQTGCS